jgi:hypothetical protein
VGMGGDRRRSDRAHVARAAFANWFVHFGQSDQKNLAMVRVATSNAMYLTSAGPLAVRHTAAVQSGALHELARLLNAGPRWPRRGSREIVWQQSGKSGVER